MNKNDDYIDFNQHTLDQLDLRLLMEMPREVRGPYHNLFHSHDFFELGVVLRGNAKWECERNHSYVCGERQGILMPAGRKHREVNESNDPHRLCWVGFVTGNPGLDAFLRGKLCSRILFLEDLFDDVARIVHSLRNEQNQSAAHGAARIRFLLGELLILLDRAAGLKQRRSGRTRPLSRNAQALFSAASYLEMNYANPMSIRQIARYHSLSLNHFTVLFSREYKMTPKKYLQTIRLREAERMLKAGDRQVKEIGVLCGFKDVARFCRWIKECTGRTPTQIRKGYFPQTRRSYLRKRTTSEG
ncbi:AraC family transcriptional regulator [Oscillatoria amoena NRMC-F 0135]|nr:AraC family transcriptional regulator [Oscillatoria amoena NRMC-F 0135]